MQQARSAEIIIDMGEEAARNPRITRCGATAQRFKSACGLGRLLRRYAALSVDFASLRVQVSDHLRELVIPGETRCTFSSVTALNSSFRCAGSMGGGVTWIMISLPRMPE